jgi:hypothetical protein
MFPKPQGKGHAGDTDDIKMDLREIWCEVGNIFKNILFFSLHFPLLSKKTRLMRL